MTHKSTFSLELGENNDLYYSLLIDEDFDFKNKNISINFEKIDNSILITIECFSLLDLKIANTAVIRSLEIIEKTLKI